MHRQEYIELDRKLRKAKALDDNIIIIDMLMRRLIELKGSSKDRLSNQLITINYGGREFYCYGEDFLNLLNQTITKCKEQFEKL